MTTNEVIQFFGSKSAVAKALRLSPAAISQWGEQVPMRRQFEIEHVSGGALRANYSGELVLNGDMLPASSRR